MQDQLNKLGDLEASLDVVWQTLMQGAASRHSAARLATLSTVVGGKPAARTIVLRGAEQKTPSVVFYTDIRSQKIKELKENPAAALTYYSVPQKFQVRLSGQAKIHHADQLTDKAWSGLKEEEQPDYAGSHAPGEETGRPIQELGGNASENFAVVRVIISELEWLQLGQKGFHRRAAFRWDAPGALSYKEWIAP